MNAFIIYTERTFEKNLYLKTFGITSMNGLVGAGVNMPRRDQFSGKPSVNQFKKNVPLEIRFSNAAHMAHLEDVLCAVAKPNSTGPSGHVQRVPKVGLCLNAKKNC